MKDFRGAIAPLFLSEGRRKNEEGRGILPVPDPNLYAMLITK